MKNHLRILLLLLLIPIWNTTAQSLETQCQRLLDSVYAANPDAVGIAIHVESPGHKLSWTSAAGYSDKETKQPLTANQPVLIASNTKTYVAAAILKLIEAKKFTLDTPIKGLISEKSAGVLEGDGYDLNAITIKHLLSHTSGIADYVNDDYFEFVNKNPSHQWTRDEQIELGGKVGSPLAKPGEKFSYADINYLLLTEVIEKITQKPFYKAIPEILNFKKNGLPSTWFVDLNDKPAGAGPLAHQYWTKYNWDSADINPSWDLYGGGGLASTTKDLALFFQLLFEGKIIKDKSLQEQMHTLVLPREQSVYCLGVKNLVFNGREAFYHGGFWGTDVMYVPSLHTTISVFTLQKDKRGLNAELSEKILQLLEKSKK